eukprot:Gb_27356 [translate_table: standard]
MDFGTIRNNLERGIYATLDQLEKDVLLVCSNAMSYNASGTIYYRQARSIQELARKTFQVLRLDPEGIELERERKPALKNKFGHSSKKSTKKPTSGKSRYEYARSDFASGATLASSGDRADWYNIPLHDSAKIRKGASLERPGGYSDGTGWSLQGHHGADGNSPAEQSEELSGSMPKATSFKDGRRDLLWEENRRATYKPWNLVTSGNESIFTTIGGDSKQLVHTGIQLEYAYARSLARFCAELGPAAWEIAAKKIEKTLPSEVPFGPGWVGEYKASHGTLLLRAESKDKQTSAPTSAIPIDLGENKAKLNPCASIRVTRDEAFTRNRSFEGHLSSLSTTTIPATSSSLPVITSVGLPLTQSSGSHSTSDTSIKSHSQGVKPIQFKAASTVVESSEVNLADTKFGSEVSQSRLLEIVSRNNRLMQWTSTKQAERAQSSLQVTNSANIGIDRRLDCNSSCVAREACDDRKSLNSSGGIIIASNAVENSVHNYQDRCRAVWPPQSSTSHDHGVQDLNQLVNSVPGKMLGLQQRVSNISANTPVFGLSSAPSTLTVRREDAVVEPWVRSRAADLTHANASSRIKMQITSDQHISTEQPQARPSSSIPQFIQQQTPLNMSSYMQSQLRGLNPWSLAKLPVSFSQEGGCSMVESSSSNAMNHFAYMQRPVGVESSQSDHRPWQALSSQFPFQQTSDLSHSVPPDLNVGFQTPKSPVRQSSGVLADSQPDLALQL